MNSDKLNAIIKKKANGNSNLSHHFHQMFFFEHVLMRLEKSEYKDNIILKGGVLLSSIIGNDLRTTKDIDATLKGLPLTIEMVEEIFKEILSIDIKDNVYFELVSIKDIRITDEYGGFRLNIKGTFYKIRTNFFIEITTGDIITPREIKYKYSSIFEDKNGNRFYCKVKYANDFDWHYDMIKRYATKEEWQDFTPFTKEQIKLAQRNCDRCKYDGSCPDAAKIYFD